MHLVLDYCPGGELFYHLTLYRRFSEDIVKYIISELLLALIYLHSLNILYRDLKPENILLDIDGHLRLSDFGLSRLDFSNHSVSDSFCGSPEYMAPEMLTRGHHTRMIDFY